MKICKECDTPLTKKTLSPSDFRRNRSICRDCKTVREREVRKFRREQSYKIGKTITERWEHA